MSMNFTDRQLDERLISEIKKLQRTVSEMRTRQRQGADVNQIVSSGLFTISRFTISAGGSANTNIGISPGDEILTLWNVFTTLYGNTVGNSLADDGTHQWPEDTISTGETLGGIVTYSVVPNYTNSFDAEGRRNYSINIKNNHSASLDFRITLKAYGLQQTY